MKADIYIKNKKAYFDYEILETFTAGLVLVGTEVKSLRAGRASLVDSFCYFDDNGLLAKSINIPTYDNGGYVNHDPQRLKRLLLTKKELKRLAKAAEQPGMTIIPLAIFCNDKGLFKLSIGIAKGKKQYDKRASLKEADAKREIQQTLKHF